MLDGENIGNAISRPQTPCDHVPLVVRIVHQPSRRRIKGETQEENA